ncbi:hypothetical protein [Bombella mellum]|uniref:hypothetical protein n=1 Tax=Bombella mellum TaxID=2039288 RepID=UPI0015F3760D|nr:hypothetical protein [Bombella mellum]
MKYKTEKFVCTCFIILLIILCVTHIKKAAFFIGGMVLFIAAFAGPIWALKLLTDWLSTREK